MQIMNFESVNKRNRVFDEKSRFLIPFLHHLMMKTLYFKLKLLDQNRIQSLKYPRSPKLGCKHIGIRKSEFVAKTKFL